MLRGIIQLEIMPWCPNCRIEYREDFTKCGDCGADLVDELPPQPASKESETRFDTEALLTTVDDEAQASVVEGLLHSCNIPTARSYKEAGSYVRVITGTSSYGIDIYVPSHNISEAQGIITSSAAEQPKAQKGFVRTGPPKRAYRERRRIAQGIMPTAVALWLALSVLIALVRHLYFK